MPKIQRVQVALVHSVDEEVVLTAAASLDKLERDFGVTVQRLNVPPTAPGQLPRIVVISSGFVINVANNRTDLFVTVPSQFQTDVARALELAAQTTQKLETYLNFRQSEYSWCGSIVLLNYRLGGPQTRLVQEIRPVFDRIVSVPRKNRAISSLNLQFGFEEGRYFVTYGVSGYETINLPVRPGPSGAMLPRPDDRPQFVVESGVGISLDVNNKPASTKHGMLEDVLDILDQIKKRIPTLLEDLNLNGVVRNG